MDRLSFSLSADQRDGFRLGTAATRQRLLFGTLPPGGGFTPFGAAHATTVSGRQTFATVDPVFTKGLEDIPLLEARPLGSASLAARSLTRHFRAAAEMRARSHFRRFRERSFSRKAVPRYVGIAIRVPQANRPRSNTSGHSRCSILLEKAGEVAGKAEAQNLPRRPHE
ncbi:hypothetical protein ACLBWH_11560 [Sphingomonas sp. M6A6_1c]